MMGIFGILFFGTLLRVGFFLDAAAGKGVLTKYTQCEALKSILYDPHYTLESLKETIFVSKYTTEGHNSNPLLAIIVEKVLAHIPQDFDHKLAFCILALVIDLAIAYQLYRLAKECNQSRTEHMVWEEMLENQMNPLIHPISANKQNLFGVRFADDGDTFPTIFAASNLPSLCAIIYSFNPATILASASGTPSIQGIVTLLLVSTMVQSVKGNAPLAALYLGVLCQVDIYNIVFLIPCALLWKHHYEFKSDELKSKRPSSFFFLFCFLFWFICVNLATIIVLGWSWETLMETYDVTNNFTNLVPNLGMDWYLFINTFTRYREYFIVMCSGFIFIFCIPLLIRFYYYPMEMIIMFQLLRSIFNPRPTLQDVSFAFGLMPIARRTLARMGTAPIFCLLAIPVPVVLYVVDHGLWLESGSGNANFMFFQCLAYNLFLGVIVLDFMSSTLRRDKALQLTEKEEIKRLASEAAARTEEK